MGRKLTLILENSLLTNTINSQAKQMKITNKGKKELGDSSVNESLDKDKKSHYEDLKHPNMELSDGVASEMGVDQ